MTKSRDASGNMQVITPGERRSSFFGSFVVPLLVVVAILLTAIFFIVKTDGGKQFIADKLGKSLGMDVELSATRIGWPYVLVLDGVSVREKDIAGPLITAEVVKLYYDIKFRKHVFVNRGELTLEQNSDGDWSPHAFSRLGDVPAENVTQLAKTLDLFDKRIVIDITDSAINWIDKADNKKHSVSGLYFKTSPIKIHTHDMRYFYLSIGAGMINGSKFDDVEKEWLASEDTPYLDLNKKESSADENGKWAVQGMGDVK